VSTSKGSPIKSANTTHTMGDNIFEARIW
jgi:hypothetical protein